ncbi:MAG: hypothetical protein KF775_07970 [Cyclobacteriaceae bacterium]|nr:hypothetical protein [Cyclobacteriaceae bacterium]
MKNKISLLVLVLALAACAVTKTTSNAPSPTGNWDYTITGTPEGDFKGQMAVTETDKILKAKLGGNGIDLPIEKFAFDAVTQKLTGEFWYGSTQVYMDVTMNGDQMAGTVSAGGMTFPFKATRVN